DSSYMKLGMEIHATVLKLNDFQNVYVYNALIALYLRCGRTVKAARIFDDLNEKDNVSWNSMIAGFVQNGLYNEGMELFCEMLDAGQKPDEVSVISIIAACGRLGKLLNGREMHAYAIRNGFYSTLQVGSSLIDMYAKCHYIDYMVRAFNVMADRDFVSWATIIAGYAQNNCHKEALELFHEVQVRGMEVDVMMIGSVLLACSGLRYLPKVKEIHCYILRRGSFDLVLQNTIVDIYGECGNIDYATRMFELIECKDVVSWTSLISSHVCVGLANEALELFYSMKETGIELDSVALVSMCSVAASLSALKKGKELHGFLIRKGFTLEGSIASSLVDLYARCGVLENART
ncbi:pentatricopeptide repeat-containing protein At3g63370, chloroplastic-like, partial [Carica papaya]|uniref:pentatricopeptide repeat-containing protein At3g63370, chloroplastic-like n=1 Tax=Carica papaya TaxID=3649 RepID=UPI000B8C9C39